MASRSTFPAHRRAQAPPAAIGLALWVNAAGAATQMSMLSALANTTSTVPGSGSVA